MRLRNGFLNTLREDTSNDASRSGQLLTKAGMIKKAGAGTYVYLPMGYKMLNKVENIIREEMNKAGAIELLMPSLLPLEVYEKCGRVDAFGDDMFKLKDRSGRDFCLGPTHEEMFTLVAKDKVKSYKDLPFNLYQQADKFRDETRSRYGLIRVKEFIMKDAYSFDTPDTITESYKKMYDAYCNIFDRMHIDYRIVTSDSGAMGGELSEEYQAISEIGEDVIALCDKCDYASNIDIACTKYDESNEEKKSIEKKHTPNCKTIEDVCNYLNVDVKNSVKALLMDVDGEMICFFVRGDRDLDLTKVRKVLNCREVEFATDELIATTNACPGFTGPVDLNCKVVIDEEIKGMRNFVVGANEIDYHFINTNIDDMKYDVCGDIATVVEGDHCPKCDGHLHLKKSIEIGNLFKLGTKYSEALGLTYLDKDNKSNPVIMGCYGIGPGRVIAAVIEQNNDDKGMILPISIAPYTVCIVPAKDSDEIMEYVYKLESELEELGIDVLVDDRDERVGVKFNDMDLLGLPIRVTVGRDFANGEVEVKLRKEDQVNKVKIDNLVDEIKEIINKNI